MRKKEKKQAKESKDNRGYGNTGYCNHGSKRCNDSCELDQVAKPCNQANGRP